MRRKFLSQLAPLGIGGQTLLSLENARPQGAKSATPPSPGNSAPSDGADLVVLNGKIWTGNSRPVSGTVTDEGSGPCVEAVAAVNGRFLAAGQNEEIRAYVAPSAQVVDLEGRLAVPGFIDSHVHFMEGGLRLLQVELKDSPNEAEFVRRLAEKARPMPAGRWILGGNWDEEAWSSAKLPARQLIDPITPDNPVFISRYDGHAALANSLALKLAGVTRESEAPAGGVIVRDAATGEPTGVLKDVAMGLVARVVPRPSEAEMEEALRGALAEAARVGVTSVHNITVDTYSYNSSFTGEIRLLRRAELKGRLTVHFYEIIPVAHWERLVEAGLSRGMGSDFLKLGAVKGFADGSLGSRTAWMFEPFDDAPGNRGVPMAVMEPPAKMEALVRRCVEASILPCIHAIGEGRWAEKRLGRTRSRTSYAWRSMLDAGVPLAFGSDWPVAPLDPILSIHAAVTGATLDGKHLEGWFPEERLTIEEGLRAFTAGSAFAALEEGEKGAISRGKLADLVVLSDDLFSIPPERIKETWVVMTVVGGTIVYRAA